ncbi:unnamed protein product [Durusdinium trenchii]|uniref:Uncharacterized protein n=1 Tax=Durusdinium trenchii TaxID=1381693 RepID=A0ABP0LW62_9DINO
MVKGQKRKHQVEETENDEVISALKELPRQELALQPFSQALRCLESSLKIDELRSSWNAETVATSLAAALGDGLWCWSFETTSDEVDSAHKALKTMLEDGRKQLLEALRSGESFCATVKRCTSKKDGQALMKLGKTRVMWLLARVISALDRRRNGWMPVSRRQTQIGEAAQADAKVLDAVRWLQEAEAILICGELEEEETGLFRLPPFSTSAGSLEYGVPAQGSWSPLRALWREHVQLDSAKLFESDPALAWAFWGFWSKRYLEGMPSAFYQCLGGWARTRPRGCFCVTGEISGHWARSIGEERLWETRGSVSHLQRIDGREKVWRVGETRMSLTTERMATGIISQMAGIEDGFNAAASVFTSFLGTKSDAKIKATLERSSNAEGSSPKHRTGHAGHAPPITEGAQVEPSLLGVSKPRLEPVKSLDIELPPSWTLQAGEVVEVRTRDPEENTCTYKWTAWHPAVVGDDSFSVFSFDGEPLRAHAVRRPKGQDLLRVKQTTSLPRDPEDSSSLARPNVKMHGDTCFAACRCDRQEKAFYQWLESLPSSCQLVLLQVGASNNEETMRVQRAAQGFAQSKLIRIGRARPPKHWAGRCAHIFHDTAAGVQQLVEALGEAPEEVQVSEGPQLPEQNRRASGAPVVYQLPDESAPSSKSSVREETNKSKQTQRDSDNLIHWDELDAIEIEETYVLGQFVDFAAGIFAESQDQEDSGQED